MGIQRVLALLGCQKIRQTLKMIRMVCEAGAHIGIGVETGIDIVALLHPPAFCGSNPKMSLAKERSSKPHRSRRSSFICAPS